MTVILKGKPVAAAIYGQIHAALQNNVEAQPCLLIMQVGEDPASQFYVSNLIKQAGKVGVNARVETLPAGASQSVLLDRIAAYSADGTVHGIMVQRPLPPGMNSSAIDAAIAPEKDVDGAHPLNAGRLAQGLTTFVPATAQAVLEVLKHYGIPTAGRRVTILGRSGVIGRPLANLLLQKGEGGDATVTVCHSKTRDIPSRTAEADILVAAVGRARFVTADMVGEGAVVIDVGVNQIEEEGQTVYVGDVDYIAVTEKASAITPVPGGVGTITTACLVRNVYYAWKRRK